MKTILVLGAGRSSSALISYLLQQAKARSMQIVVGDAFQQAANERIGSSDLGRSVLFDIQQEEASARTISSADVVISLLPAHFHPLVARHCLTLAKHLITASYVSHEMKSFQEMASAKNLLFLNECGLDPGIDHMSAMQIIDRIKKEGGKLNSFESFTGGLIAPETDPENPWRYKFTWNPRNVVMAGQGTARFLQDGQFKYISYQQLFKRTTPVTVPGHGEFEGYANRDSLTYIETYRLQGIQTMLRGTLRNKGYCPAWDVFVQLGCCDDSYQLEGVEAMTHRGFLDAFLDLDSGRSVEEKLIRRFQLKPEGPEMSRIKWSGFLTDELVGITKGTPAQVMECILNKKWRLNPADKDMIVMWHRFIYEFMGSRKQIQSALVVKGEDSIRTAMARTVGLPLGIAAILLLEGKIKSRGVCIPTQPEIYEPVLKELRNLGIQFEERES